MEELPSLLPNLPLGQEPPLMRVRPPGPESRTWLLRAKRVAAPMGPRGSSTPGRASTVPRGGVVFATGCGVNLVDVDGNRYLDLAAGFGSLLLGHGDRRLLRVVNLQAGRLLQALGDVHPADAKIALLERLAELWTAQHGAVSGASVLLGQSGSDAVTAAIKTAVLATARPRLLAFESAYHGLSYAPLAACGLRASYRDPFTPHLGDHVSFLAYPASRLELDEVLTRAKRELEKRDIAAVLVEPVLGRGGVVVPPVGFLNQLSTLAHEHGSLVIADEIWTGLGRAGAWLKATADGAACDLVCLGKGLGGGIPISALVGARDIMSCWSREQEVVHTSTFAGAPLGCAAAICCLDILKRDNLIERARVLGESYRTRLQEALSNVDIVSEVRGTGLMVGIQLTAGPGSASEAVERLLSHGVVASTGGGAREVIVLTPPLIIESGLLDKSVDIIAESLASVRGHR